MRSNIGGIATEIGTVLHKVLEVKARNIMNHEAINYTYLSNILKDGIEEKTEKGTEKVLGISKLSAKYFDDYFKADDASGMTYPEKIDLFLNEVIKTRLEDDRYKPLGCEIPFEFVYNYGDEDNKKEIILHGFIDSVREDEDGNIKLVDYKSSKKVFPEAKIKTPMQMFIYDLACYYIFGRVPSEHEYDFILINQKQNESDGVCSLGYQKRGEKKLNKVLSQIEEMKSSGAFQPKPSPLCYWCFANDTKVTPNADPKFSGACEYYSLWKPEDRVFNVNKKWGEEEENLSRRLVF